MKLLLALASVLAVCMATVDSNDAVRRYMLNTNRSPKKQTYNALDLIMVRGRNGHLTSWRDHLAVNVNRTSTDSAVCDDCQKVVRWAAAALKDGEKIEQFKGLLDMLCDYLEGEEKDTCKNIVNNMPALIHMLEKATENPRELCTELALCSAGDVPRVVRLLVRYASARVDGQVKSNDVMCDECLFVANELKAIVMDKSTSAQVMNMLKNACAYFGDEQQQCKNLIDDYFPLVWSELESLLADGHGLCDDLGLCNSATTKSLASLRRPLLRLVPAAASHLIKNSLSRASLPARQTPRLDASARFLRRIQTAQGMNVGCTLCKIGLTGFKDYFKNNPQALSMLANDLQSMVCEKVLPKAYMLDCKDFLNMYLHPVMYMTLEEINPDTMCDALKMCKKSDVLALSRMSAAEKSAVLCEACNVAAEFAQHEMGDKAVQDDIVHYVEQACTELPNEMLNECKSMVETYAPALFQTAAQELNPEVVCPALHMCPQRRRAPAVKSNKQ